VDQKWVVRWWDTIYRSPSPFCKG